MFDHIQTFTMRAIYEAQGEGRLPPYLGSTEKQTDKKPIKNDSTCESFLFIHFSNSKTPRNAGTLVRVWKMQMLKTPPRPGLLRTECTRTCFPLV